jgi:hypothetical protein
MKLLIYFSPTSCYVIPLWFTCSSVHHTITYP